MPKLSGQSMVCDSSALISLTDSCFVHAIYFLKKKYRGKFIIPRAVEHECIGHPLTMKNQALHALRIKRAINDGMILVSSAQHNRTEEIMQLANSIFFADTKPIRLLHDGEAEVLALALELSIGNILMDERTTRMLVEGAESLRIHLAREFNCEITTDEAKLSEFTRIFSKTRFFRSSELLLLAYEKGYFEDYKTLSRDAIEASLYRLKYAGCAVGFGEIEKYVAKEIRKR